MGTVILEKGKEGEQMDIKEKVKNLPLTPGVYLMKDQTGTDIFSKLSSPSTKDQEDGRQR
jgi:hypothetical protein